MRLLKGSGKTDSESDVLNFVVNMIHHNYFKQRQLQGSAEESNESESINSYTKLDYLAKKINRTYEEQGLSRVDQAW